MSSDRGDGRVSDDVHAHGVAHSNEAGATVGTTCKSTRMYGPASTLGDVVGDDIPVNQPIPYDDNDAFDDDDVCRHFIGQLEQ